MAITHTTKDAAAEGAVSLKPGPIFAATQAVFCLASDKRFDPAAYTVAPMQPSKPARRNYISLRNRRIDPLVAVRHSAGRVDVRVFPVVKGNAVTVFVEGFVLLTRHHTETRVYGDDARCMIVAKGGGLRFVDRSTVKSAVIEIPCVAALETAFTGKGTGAVSSEVCLGYPIAPPTPPAVHPGATPGDVEPPPPPPADPQVKRAPSKSPPRKVAG